MAAEYQLVADLEASRVKLQQIVDTQVEIRAQTLFECGLDILASRGGERWRRLDELRLSTKAGISVILMYREAVETTSGLETLFITTRQPDGIGSRYRLPKEIDGGDIFCLYDVLEIGKDTNQTPSNRQGLAEARLLSILADAHMNSPFQELDEGNFW